MPFHHVPITVTIGNSISWKYVLPIDIENSVMEVKWFTPDQLEKASEIYIEIRGEKSYTIRKVAYRSNSGDIFHFDKLGETEIELDKRLLTIDYTDALRFTPVDRSQRELYIQKSMFENMDEYNSMSYKIQRSLQSEPVETRSMLRFMLELNSKLDDVLELLRGTASNDGYKKVQSVGLNAEGFIFHDDALIPDGTLVYTSNIVGHGEDRIKFSALTEITQMKPADTGYFYKAGFLKLKADVVDSIVKYLFAREREMIKGVREL